MKRISLEQLIESKRELSYEQQYRYITRLLKEGAIKPLKASKTNGKKPALYREYWIVEPKKDYSALVEELEYQLYPGLSIDYYLAHPEVYERERAWVLPLSNYLKQKKEKLEYQVSANERSFEIWGREKFLVREQGKAVLKHCKLTEGDLNMYETSEPLAYYSYTREIPQNMVILENKDTFYSMRRYMLDGNEKIFGVRIGTLIYGAGKGILKKFQDFSICLEPCMSDKKNKIYYFGDLDYEGIGIYENLAALFQDEWDINPFIQAYERMIEKAKDIGIDGLPKTKEGQNRNIDGFFFRHFPRELADRMKAVIESGKYIPQEILNISDFYR